MDFISNTTMLNIDEIPDDEIIGNGSTNTVESVLSQTKPINPSFTIEDEVENEVFQNDSDEEQTCKPLYTAELNSSPTSKQTNTPRADTSVETQCYQHDIPLEIPKSTNESTTSMSSDVIVSTIGIQVEFLKKFRVRKFDCFCDRLIQLKHSKPAFKPMTICNSSLKHQLKLNLSKVTPLKANLSKVNQ